MKSTRFITIGLIFLSPWLVCGQTTGVLSGTVSLEDREPLPDAYVLLSNIQKGDSTDANGRYVIENIPPGTYQVIVRHSGLPPKHDTVTIEANTTKHLNIRINFPPPAMAAPDTPRAHAWDMLYRQSGEEPGYGMYTYVLLNRPTRTSLNDQAWVRYEALIKAIKKTTPFAEHLENIPKEDLNLFLIPTISDTIDGNLNEKKLNQILSSRILTGIAIETEDLTFRQTINNNPGPFLISSLVPISSQDSGQVNLLYVDLTRTNPAAMAEVVGAYKKRLTSENIEGIERFRSVRLALLDLFLDADDHIIIVKTASAFWLGG